MSQHMNLAMQFSIQRLILPIQKVTLSSKEKFEIAANTFAAELLIEDSLFDEYKHHTIEEMAAMENLPIELIKIKLNYI